MFDQGARLGRHLALATLAAVTTLAAGAETAHAAGFFLPGRGVKPLGRGGAYVASGGGDLNSLWYNPANLAGLEQTRLTVDLSLISLDMEFQRAPRVADNGDTITYPAVANEAPPKPDPQILIGGPLPGDRDLTWAFGLYAPYLSGHTFPEDGPQRYVLIDNDASLLAYTHFALAWQLGDGFRVGAGIQNLGANFVLVNKTSAYTGLYGDPEDPDLDILTRITMTSLLNPTGNLGVWIKMMPGLEAAMSVQLPARIRDRDARIETRLPDNAFFANAEVNGDSIDGALSFPLMARMGLRYHRSKIDYELALVYENWSVFKEIAATPNDVTVDGVPGVGSIRVAPLSIPMNYRDTISVRNGMQIDIRPDVAARLGYTFETGAIPDEYYSVFLADANKHVLTLGGTYSGKTWSVDGAFAYYLMPDRSITTSQVRQINPTDTAGENTLVVGNGEYSQRYLIFGLGFNKDF